MDNLGGQETTRVENLRLYGETMDVTRMSEFKKKEDALKAIAELNGKELIGKKLSVEEAVENR